MIGKTPEQLRTNFWNDDIRQGGLIYSQYQEIKRVMESSDMEWTENKLEQIKSHAIAHTPFYSNYNVSDAFPVLDKMQILEHYNEHKAKEGFETPTHVSSTSGSTGTPFAVIQDLRKRKRTIADLQVFGELCDYPSHERMLFFRVINSKLHRTPDQEDRENIYYIDSSNLGEKHLGEMVQAIIDKEPRIIFSYSSTLVELAKYIDEKWNGAKDFSMVSVLTGGEGISDENRELLERVFRCKVYRRYSDMELGILGQDKGDGSAYELNWGSYYFECLKMDSDEPVESGEVGRIVVTDLFNLAFPLIRYDTGDLGIMVYPSDGRLPYLKEIYGRVRDCVYATDGTLLSPAKIFVTMWGVEGVKQWQFIQETADGYVLKLNCSEQINPMEIIDKLKGVLGTTANIDVQFVDEIPVVSSNKRRAVICNYQKEA